MGERKLGRGPGGASGKVCRKSRIFSRYSSEVTGDSVLATASKAGPLRPHVPVRPSQRSAGGDEADDRRASEGGGGSACTQNTSSGAGAGYVGLGAVLGAGNISFCSRLGAVRKAVWQRASTAVVPSTILGLLLCARTYSELKTQ